MKILIVGQYFWPDNFLINEIASELVKRGNNVTVLTGLPDYSTSKIPPKYRWGKNRKENYNGVNIVRVPIIARHHGVIWRIFNYMSFFINSSIYAKTHKFDCDVIFSYQTAPVLMINPAMILKKKLKKPLFIYVLDLWPDQMKVWHIYENNPIYKIVLKYCKKAYGSGDKVGITSRPFKNYLMDICNVDEDKIIYLPQHSSRLYIKNINKKEKCIDLIYAGNIGQQQNLQCLLKAIQLLKTDKLYKIHIYGDGTSYQECLELAKTLNICDKVIFYGRVDKEVLSNAYQKADAFILTLCSESEMGFAANTVPAKLQGYMSAGKPILASIDGGASEVIKESKCGIVVPSGDYKKFANIIDNFIENKYNNKKMGENAIKYFNDNYEMEKVINKIENILNSLIKEE